MTMMMMMMMMTTMMMRRNPPATKRVPARSSGRDKGDAAAMQVPGAPEMESCSDRGMESGGIVRMVAVLESDFARLVSETSATKADAQYELEGCLGRTDRSSPPVLQDGPPLG